MRNLFRKEPAAIVPARSVYWEDRVIGAMGIVGTVILCVVMAYEWGHQDGVASVPACKPKVVRGEYSTEELHRMWRARKRMEAVK